MFDGVDFVFVLGEMFVLFGCNGLGCLMFVKVVMGFVCMVGLVCIVGVECIGVCMFEIVWCGVVYVVESCDVFLLLIVWDNLWFGLCGVCGMVECVVFVCLFDWFLLLVVCVDVKVGWLLGGE